MKPRPLILFLDLDGVFKTNRSIYASMRFDPVISKLVNDLCRLPDTRVVISATCRMNFDTKEDAEFFWRDLGMPDLQLHDDWLTIPYSLPKRSVEIQHWLMRNRLENEVEYLFIDDEMPLYDDALEQWAHETLRQGWLLIGGHQNGANYQQLRTLRHMFDDRQKAYEEAEATTADSAAERIITSRKVAESNRQGRNWSREKIEAQSGGDSPDSLSADAQSEFSGIYESSIGLITIRQHVSTCKAEGCSICDARFDPRTLVPGFESHEIPQRSPTAAAHAEAEKAQRDYDGS